MEINGKVAIVTGASGGIGAAIARELARHGASVVLAARRAAALEQLKAAIEAAGGRALVVPTDVTQRADLERLVATTHATFGRIDILINNAGLSPGQPIGVISAERMAEVITVNLLAPMWLTNAVVPLMRQQGGGLIVNIGSVAGEVATNSTYAASKFGLRGFNDGIRRELRHAGIDVVLIAPGFIRTAMTVGARFPMPGPDVVARAVIAAIRRPRRKVVVPWPYRPLMLVAKLLPWLSDALLGRRRYQTGYQQRKQLAERQRHQAVAGHEHHRQEEP